MQREHMIQRTLKMIFAKYGPILRVLHSMFDWHTTSRKTRSRISKCFTRYTTHIRKFTMFSLLWIAWYSENSWRGERYRYRNEVWQVASRDLDLLTSVSVMCEQTSILQLLSKRHSSHGHQLSIIIKVFFHRIKKLSRITSLHASSIEESRWRRTRESVSPNFYHLVAFVTLEHRKKNLTSIWFAWQNKVSASDTSGWRTPVRRTVYRPIQFVGSCYYSMASRRDEIW